MAAMDETLDEILPGLFLCNYQQPQRDFLLRKYRITHILTVCEDLPPLFPDRITYKVAEIDDSPEIKIRDIFEENNAFIDGALKTGGRVIVHCLMGVSRSATTVIAYVMWKSHIRFPEALEFVRSRHSDTDPNSGFVQQLKDYQCFLFPEDERDVYRCQCGALLFQEGEIMHTGQNCDQYFLKVGEWMKAWGDDGPIRCYLCRKEIGEYHNEGSRMCTCGTPVTPFYFVDKNVCIGGRGPAGKGKASRKK